MNWEIAGSVAEMLGAAGVILSLFYLATQIRAQNRERQRATISECTNQWNQWTGSFSENPQLSALWSKGSSDYASLTQPELVQYAAHYSRLFRVCEGLHEQYKLGHLDDKTWLGWRRAVEDISSLPGVKSWWPTRRHWYNDDFASFIQPLIDSKQDQTMY